MSGLYYAPRDQRALRMRAGCSVTIVLVMWYCLQYARRFNPNINTAAICSIFFLHEIRVSVMSNQNQAQGPYFIMLFLQFCSLSIFCSSCVSFSVNGPDFLSYAVCSLSRRLKLECSVVGCIVLKQKGRTRRPKQLAHPSHPTPMKIEHSLYKTKQC